MLSEDITGGRQLSLRRRRSRLPWIYSLYHVTRSEPFATLSAPLTSCAPSQYGSTRIKIPAPGTEDDDKNPPRIKARSLFDVAVGHDNLFHGDRYKWGLRFTVINLTNKVALYNFLSTFSGTHFVTPRTYTAELGFHF